MMTTRLPRALRGLSLFADPAAAGLSDQQLLERFAAARDEAAFAALVRRYGRIVLGVCRNELRHLQDAEDAFQATFLILARKAGSLDLRGPLGNWLGTVARRVARRGRAGATRRQHRERLAARRRAEAPDALPRPYCREVLDEELRRLPEEYRAPLVLCYLQGKTCAEAARELGCPRGSMSWRLARARERLRERLLSRGVAFPAAGLGGLLAGDARALPPRLLERTTRAALEFSAGRAPAGPAGRLAAGALKAMTATRLTVAVAMLLALGLLGSGAALLVRGGAVAPPPAEAGTPGKESADGLPAPARFRLGEVPFRHGGKVVFVAFAPGGKRLVSAGADGSVNVWDAGTGREVRRFEGPAGERKGPGTEAVEKLGLRGHLRVALSPDCKTLVAARDGTVVLWDVAGGKELHRLRGVVFGGNALAFTPDGKAVLLAGLAGSLDRWDVATGKRTPLLAGRKDVPERALAITGGASALSPDGKTLARQHYDAVKGFSIRLHDVASGKQLAPIPTGMGAALSLTFAPDGKTLAWGTVEGNVQLWDRGANKPLRRLGAKEVGNRALALAFSPDGKLLATSRPDRTVRVWEVATGKLRRVLDEPVDEGRRTVRFAGADMQGQPDLAFAPDGKTLAAGCGGHVVRLFDVTTGKELAPPRLPDGASAAALSPDGKTLAARTAGGTLALLDAATGKELHSWDQQMGIAVLALSPSGKVLAMRDSVVGAVVLYDGASGQKLRALGKEKSVFENALAPPPGPANVRTPRMVFAPGGKLLAAADDAGQLSLWEVDRGRKVREFLVPRGEVVARFDFSPDGRMLAAHNLGGSLTLYEVATGLRRCGLGKNTGHFPRPAPPGLAPDLFENYQDDPHAVAVSPDGQLLAASAGPAVVIWDVFAGKELKRLRGHCGAVVSLAFAADGKRLFSGSADTSVLVWDAADFRKAGKEPPRLSAEALDGLWADLASARGEPAFAALRRLRSAPRDAVALLRDRLRPAAAVPPERIARLVADLSDRRFQVREAATRELERLGDLAAPGLRAAQAWKPSLEVRKRLEQLLRKLSDESPQGERLRELRAGGGAGAR
jgi:RNA polymerase sigma factor (sigma-70 family)